MTQSRSVVFALLLALATLWPGSPARADQAFQRFLPLFVDLDGWQGKKPDGMSMDMQNVSMTTAMRDYQRGPAEAHASVMMGQAAIGALASFQKAMNLQTSEGHVLSANLNGLPVIKTFNIPQKSGAILVQLNQSALFSFAYKGITEDEALALAQKFDWKAIQAAAQAK